MRKGHDRALGALLGVAVGDALGSTLEFMSRSRIEEMYDGNHREIVGGGAFGWRPGQGTDDTDLTAAVVQAYLDGYSLSGVASRMLSWFKGRPRDVGGTTAAALSTFERTGDAVRCGEAVLNDRAAGNGSLMRCIATGIVQADPITRAKEASEISRVTHADERCVDACVAYCDIVSNLIDGMKPSEAIDWVRVNRDLHSEVVAALEVPATTPSSGLATSGYVVHSLTAAVWSVKQNSGVEEPLVALVNLGADADTTGAIAGGVLGACYGAAGVPRRWIERLEYASSFTAATPVLAELREDNIRDLSNVAR